MSLLSTTTAGGTRTTWSHQLQFNFKCRKSPLLLLRARVLSYDRRHGRLLVQCVAQDEAKSGSESEKNGPKKNSESGSSWVGLGSDVDWFGNSGGSQHKQGIGGMLGIGLASILLVAGITSAALSIGKRSSSRPRQEMEPLTEQQELLVTSGDEVYKEVETTDNVMSNAQDDGNTQKGHSRESKAGTEDGVSSTLELPIDNVEVQLFAEKEKSTVVGIDDSIKDDILSGSVLPDFDSPGLIPASPEFRHPESVDAYVDSQNTESGNISGENPDVVGLNISDAESLGGLEQPGTFAGTVRTTLESSSSTNIPLDSQGLYELAADKSDATLDTVLSSSDIAVAVTPSTDKDQGLLMADQVFGDSIGVGTSDAENSVAQSLASIQNDGSVFSTPGIPAPSLLSVAVQVPPGNVVIPAVTDQTQAQALAALQVLKVIESDAKAGDLCTRREYARWLVSASSALSRNLILKVYPAMCIENATELAFDDITPEDPDFTSIQGLAEAGLISSKLSRRDLLSSPDEDIGSFYFHPDSPLSRQDLVTWKMALEKRQLPEADKKVLHQLSGFIDIDRIDQDAFPALVADISAGEQGIVALAFGYTRLFQPDKPVTKGQAAIALATGESADVVSEELARIEAESVADKAVAAHSALVAEVEKDINANFELELLMEREKIDVVQKMAEEARQEVERLRAEREEENSALMKQRAGIESEMEVLSRLRHELEEQLQGLMSNKVEISYEKQRIEKLKKETEEENQAITRLQYELEVERKALSMARAWAEDEAKRVQDHARALEEARDRWERRGIKVVVDKDLLEESSADVTWSNVGKQLSVEETVQRAENLNDKLKAMAGEVRGKSKELINKIIEKIQALITTIKEWISKAGRRTIELRDFVIAKTGGSIKQLQEQAVGLGSTVKEGAKRVGDDCREGVEKVTQRFKT